jgi:hypothetical protein
VSLVATPAAKASPGAPSSLVSRVLSYLEARWPQLFVLGLIGASTIYTVTMRSRSLTSGKALRHFLSMIGEMLRRIQASFPTWASLCGKPS